MIQSYKSGESPQGMVQSMLLAKNPRAMQAMQLIRRSGGNMKTAFYNLAAEKGVDPNSILSMLK